jgi:hypothetical protein
VRIEAEPEGLQRCASRSRPPRDLWSSRRSDQYAVIEMDGLWFELLTIKDGEEPPSSVLEGPILDDMTVLGWLVGLGLEVDDVNGSDRVWVRRGGEER